MWVIIVGGMVMLWAVALLIDLSIGCWLEQGVFGWKRGETFTNGWECTLIFLANTLNVPTELYYGDGVYSWIYWERLEWLELQDFETFSLYQKQQL